MEFSCGQPWLVNALARECVEEIHGFRYGETVTVDDIGTAKETIIRRRDTHVDSLMERLREPRVRRVVEPVIFGGERTVSSNSEDWRFVVDLGLLRENSGADRRAYEYGEATPHLVLMAFLQRVTNGKGHIIREMALGSKRLDLCVEYRDKRYAVEVKTSKNFAGENSYKQLAGYLGTLGLPEGWMAIFDEGQLKSWDEKLYRRDVEFDGKTLHIVGL